MLMRVDLILPLGDVVGGLMNGAMRKGYRHWTYNSGSNALEKRCCSSGMKKRWRTVGGEPAFMAAWPRDAAREGAHVDVWATMVWKKERRWLLEVEANAQHQAMDTDRKSRAASGHAKTRWAERTMQPPLRWIGRRV